MSPEKVPAAHRVHSSTRDTFVDEDGNEKIVPIAEDCKISLEAGWWKVPLEYKPTKEEPFAKCPYESVYDNKLHLL
jgi:hypothetical protein